MKINTLYTLRAFYGYSFLVCGGLLAMAYYFEMVMGLYPCPLCIFQRIAFLGIAIVSLLAWIQNPRGWSHLVYNSFSFIFAALGILFSGRQVWLENLPPGTAPACAPNLDYLLNHFPLLETLKTVIFQSGECAEVVWSFLGLSMAGWTLLFFIGFVLLAVVQMIRYIRSR